MSNSEPRSIRLTQEHRRDMVAAVLAEWRKQNPAPETDVSFHEAVVDQIKLSEAYNRTQRLRTHLAHDDWKHINLREGVLVTITDSEGNRRNTTQIEFPVALARRLGLEGIDTGITEYKIFLDRNGDAEHRSIPNVYKGLKFSDIVDEHTRIIPESEELFEHASVCSLRWVTSNNISVQVSDDCDAYKAYRAAQKAHRAWEKERYLLESETSDLLQQFNTTKQIRDGWPAMVPYFPPHIADPESVVHLPILAVDRLSERLGIK